MSKLMNYISGLIALVAVVAALWGWYHPKIMNVPGPKITEYVNVEIPKPYRIITRQTVTVEKIVVMEKEKVVTKEKWPDWFTGDPNQQLTAVGLVKPYRGDTECASVINLQTGASQILTKRLPVPLFDFDNTLRAGFLLGYGFTGHIEWQPVRVGNFYATLGAAATFNGGQHAEAFGAGANYEW